MKRLILLTIFLGFSSVVTSYAQSKVSQKEKFEATYNKIKAIVQSKDYQFVGEMVYHNKKRERLEVNSNTVTVDRNNVSGKVSSLSSKRTTIEVDGRMKNYNVNFDDDSQQISIEFTSDNVGFYIDVKPNGNAFLTAKRANSEITQVGKIKDI
ncbi:DUF4251 domain-containing protein [Winogradskyella sp.]|uniref:DUF4251 domain-containing protein n=1 Tax=Winogradskyella sp. TaxID=1883156 RepID=UPI0026287F30|nr:DUF4251 domain-containing protein [Winogradskyella sp.]